jgi:hypothetical protein
LLGWVGIRFPINGLNPSPLRQISPEPRYDVASWCWKFGLKACFWIDPSYRR